jgi:hypothetical protein
MRLSMALKMIRPLRQYCRSCAYLPVGLRERSVRCVGRKPLRSSHTVAMMFGSDALMRSSTGRQWASAQSQKLLR